MDLDVLFGLESKDSVLNELKNGLFNFTCLVPPHGVLIFSLYSIIGSRISVPIRRLLSHITLVCCHVQHAVSRSDYDNVIGALPYLKVDRNAK